MTSVQLKNITKSYSRGKFVIHDFSLAIEQGEFVVLVGPSGCGKSTLLRIVAGLETVDEGEVLIAGQVVNNMPPKNRDIAMVFQNYALYPHMNVYNNMAFGLKLRKTAKDQIDQQVRKTANILDISDLLHRKPKELSGGQRQRVALGRAIVRNPQVFLFDEPLSNLDAKLRVQMRTEIKKLHTELNTTMIYVTHDQVEAMTMGDRVVILKDGFIQQVGTPIEVYQQPANMFVGSFIGSPAMNFIAGKIENDFFTAPDISLDVSRISYLNQNYAAILLGIRPEDIEVGKGPITAEVIVTELLGNEAILHLRAGDTIIAAKSLIGEPLRPGSKVPINLNSKKICFFESESQKRIE